ncbi:MAG TPA: hypothetical protein VLI06_02400 [Solimonas sp.]|nr:hypothetical protein [Solimonas sp.]
MIEAVGTLIAIVYWTTPLALLCWVLFASTVSDRAKAGAGLALWTIQAIHLFYSIAPLLSGHGSLPSQTHVTTGLMTGGAYLAIGYLAFSAWRRSRAAAQPGVRADSP